MKRKYKEEMEGIHDNASAFMAKVNFLNQAHLCQKVTFLNLMHMRKPKNEDLF